MEGEGKDGYVPPVYIPLGGQSLLLYEGDDDEQSPQWASGICACCDDMQSCCIGLMCPCYLFGKNAEFLGSGTLAGSCVTHFILWGFFNSLCCLLSDGTLLGLPGCLVACYACGYRKTLRSKYDLPEAPCGDLATHLFCHLCAICQEYREIRDRSGPLDFRIAQVRAPPVQTMTGWKMGDALKLCC